MKKTIGSKYLKFLLVYISILIVASAVFLFRVFYLLKSFEASQPERLVERQIELLCKSAKDGELEKVLPVSEEMKNVLGTDKYPDEFVKEFLKGELTYEQKLGSYGAGESAYTIKNSEKDLVTLNLKSTNTRTEMIVFTCADWSISGASANMTAKSFAVPENITVSINGKKITGTPDGNGNLKYSVSVFADTPIAFTDSFGYTEQQKGSIRNKFATLTFTVPSNFKVLIDGISDPETIKTGTSPVPQLAYVAEYADVPSLCKYSVPYIPRPDNSIPTVNVEDNLANIIQLPKDGKLEISEQSALPDVPQDIIDEAGILTFAENWSLFMTNDLSGGLGAISKSLIKDSYLYEVAYKWATGVDRTFTSIHRLYNPPFEDERIYNYVRYSDNLFSCDVHLVKKMRIANGLDVDDVLSRRLFFVKYDTTNNGKDDPKWVVADMIGTEDEAANTNGGDGDE